MRNLLPPPRTLAHKYSDGIGGQVRRPRSSCVGIARRERVPRARSFRRTAAAGLPFMLPSSLDCSCSLPQRSANLRLLAPPTLWVLGWAGSTARLRRHRPLSFPPPFLFLSYLTLFFRSCPSLVLAFPLFFFPVDSRFVFFFFFSFQGNLKLKSLVYNPQSLSSSSLSRNIFFYF